MGLVARARECQKQHCACCMRPLHGGKFAATCIPAYRILSGHGLKICCPFCAPTEL